MKLPFDPPLEPMLAILTDEVPVGPGWLYEPKWDGFRTMVFWDGDELFLQSRDRKPLLRYFPELDEPMRQLPPGVVVDGELVIARGGVLEFELLQMRLHPAASRIGKLAKEIPARFVAFDLLARDGVDLRARPLSERRLALEATLATAQPPVHLTPITTDPEVARDWFARFEGAGLDGVVAKRAESVYTPGKRTMIKVKHTRTSDCVVAGFRWFKDQRDTQVGSLLLGLYDPQGKLRPIGVASSFSVKDRIALLEKLGPYREDAAAAHPWTGRGWEGPGGGSRWSAGKDLSWEPLRIELVAEIAWSQLAGDRFRHPGHLVRWRPDKSPADCSLEQLVVAPASEISALFA